MNLSFLTNGQFFEFINRIRKRLKVSIQAFCKECGISTSSYYKMRRKELKFQFYLRLVYGFLRIAPADECDQYLLDFRHTFIPETEI